MIVKIPDQRQFPDGGIQQRFDDLVKYLLEKFGLQQANALLRDRYQLESNHDTVLPGFSDILTYAAGDLPIPGISPSDHSPAGTSNTDTSQADRLYGDGSPNGKCIAVEVHGVAHLATATAEMNAVAARNPRVKDPAYHFILSWPEHETPPSPSAPSNEAVFDAARHAIAALGLSEHQYVIAIHGNTDNLHCHVAVNRVHPTTYKSQHMPYSRRTLHRAARESEIKHNWSHDNGIFIVELDEHGQKCIVKNPHVDIHNNYDTHSTGTSTVGLSATEHLPTARSPKALSPWTDPESLLSWTRSTIAPLLKEALPTMPNWAALHTFLAQYRITLQDTGGGGMRLTAQDDATGEVLDVPVSKALRLLKRADLEARWGSYEAPTSITTVTTQRRIHHVHSFDQFDQFAPHPEPTTRRQHLRGEWMSGSDVAGHEIDSEMLLPRDAPDHMEHREGDFDSGLRRPVNDRAGSRTTDGSLAGKSHLAPSTIGTSNNASFGVGRSPKITSRGYSSQFDFFDTLTRRAQRREERAAARTALRRRFREYRDTVKATHTAHDAKKKALLTAQRVERKAQTDAFSEARRLLQRDLRNRHDPQATHPELAILAANHNLAKQTLALAHLNQRKELSLTRLPALPWRDWLVEQAQLGDQAALSALRGIVYQAKRDNKLSVDSQAAISQSDRSTIVTSLDGTSPTQQSQGATSPTATSDPDLSAYITFIAQLREEEKRERAIRSANPRQARPYQCDPLLVTPSAMTYRVTGNGNVQFFDAHDHHLFTDRGNRLTFDRKIVTDDELRQALLHAREKFGNRLTLTGEDPIFTARMARMADDLGMTVLNPEMRAIIADHREAKRQASLTPPLSAPQEPTPTTTSPQLDTTNPTPTLTTTPEQSIPTPAAPELVPPQPVTSPIRRLPAETSLEVLRQEILATNPRATFLMVDPQLRDPNIGRIVAQQPDAFAQRIGRNTFALHAHPLPAGIPPNHKGAVHIAYEDGQPTYIATPAKTRDRGNSR